MNDGIKTFGTRSVSSPASVIAAIVLTACGGVGTVAAAASTSGGSVEASILIFLAYGALAVTTPALVVIDVREHRLPNRWVLPLYPISLVCFVCAAFVIGDASRLFLSVSASAIAFTFFSTLPWCPITSGPSRCT